MSSGIAGIQWLYYSVPTRFSFNSTDTIASILAEIPFDAVGIFGIGVFTLFMYTALVDRLSICLFSSVLLAFISVIFDLAQLIARGKTTTGTTAGIDVVQGLVTVREIGLALSLALRYVWFTGFVVRRIQVNGVARVADINPFSWRSLGVFGRLVQCILLAASATIFGLQVAWRVDSQLSHTGPVYYTSAGFETGASVVLVGKLVLNCVLNGNAGRWSLIRTYTVPTLALFFGVAVAIGNFAYFPFSETVLGRFLQAVELYLMILWSMADAFSRQGDVQPRGLDEPPMIPVQLRRGSTLRLSLRQTSMPSLPHLSSQPSLSQSILYPISQQDGRSRNSRPSMISRVSFTSWLGGRRIPRSQAPYYADDEQLWTQDQAERGLSPVIAAEKSPSRISEEDRSFAEPKQSAKWVDPMFATVLSESPEQVDDVRILADTQPFSLSVVNTPIGAESMLNNVQEFGEEPAEAPSSSRVARASSSTINWRISVQPPESIAEPPPVPPTTSLSSLIAAYQREGTPPMPQADGSLSERRASSGSIALPPRSFLSTGLDSPVYGLDGVRGPSPMRDPSPSGLSPSQEPGRQSFLRMSSASTISSQTDIDELLRRQQELDRSIEKLKIGPSTTGPPSSFRTETSSVSRPSYVSGSSEISLDQFPAPPWVNRPLAGSPRSSLARPRSVQFAIVTPPSRSVKRRSNSVNSIDLQPPRMPAALAERRARQVSVPETLRDSTEALDEEGRSSARSPKFDSKGTEYEITSFIGDLTSDQSRTNRPSISHGSAPSDSTQSSVVLETAQRLSATKPVISSPLRAKQSSPTIGGPPRKSSMRYIRPEELPLGSDDGRAAIRDPVARTAEGRDSLMPPTNAPKGPRLLPTSGRVIGLPPRPAVRKDMISSPRPLGAATASQSAGVFEQPRKAPGIPRPAS